MDTSGNGREADSAQAVCAADFAAGGACSDEELARLAAEGDEAARFALVRRCEPLVLNRAAALSGRRRDEAVFRGAERLFWAVSHYADAAGSSFSDWAVRCIGGAPSASGELLPETAADGQGAENMPSAGGVGAEAETDLDQLLNAIPAEVRKDVWTALSALEKRVFLLYNEGSSYQEMAEAMGRPVKSVDNALCRIKRKITGALGRGSGDRA